MRLTQHTDLALRVLIYLALNGERRTTIRQIAQRYRISRNHLMKVVHQLAMLGFVRTVRGAGGGIQLASRREAIRIGEIVSLLEPDFALVECFRPTNQCVITPACRLPGLLDEAHRAFIRSLDRYTLADLITAGNQDQLKLLLKL